MAFKDAYGIITNYHLSDSEWYTTQLENEVILFKDKDGVRKEVNDWVIFANSTDLLVQLVKTNSRQSFAESEEVVYESDTIVIGAGDTWASGKIRMHGIKVLGLAGQNIKYIANYF